MQSLALVRALTLSVIANLLGGVSASAQGWVLDATAGRSSYGPASTQVESLGTSLGLRHEGARWMYVSAGIPSDTAGVPWGALGLGARLASQGRAGIGLDGAAHAFGYRDRLTRASGGGAVLEAMPLVYGSAGPARVEIRSGLLHYARAYGSEAVSRSLHQSDARLRLVARRVTLGGEARYVRAAEGGYPYVGAVAEGSVGLGSVWASGGRWLSEAVETPVWGAGARLRTPGRTEVFASVQQETNDPVYWNVPRRSWSVGMSLRLGGAPRPPAPPVRMVAPGRVVFRLPLSFTEGAPTLAGDFTGWKPVPMTRSGESWTLSLAVAPGVHRYAFRTAEGEWFVPEGVAGRVEDDMGVAAVLVVPR